MDKKLENKVAIVTDASKGLGAGIAKQGGSGYVKGGANRIV